MIYDTIPNVIICGTIVDIVDQEKQMGNIFFDNIYKRDMKGLVCDFCRCSNAVIANLNMCDSQRHSGILMY